MLDRACWCSPANFGGDTVRCTKHPTSNQLLAALPAEELARWQQALEPVEWHLGQVLYESGSPQSHVYFPCTAIVSLLYVTESGQSAEIALVGHEGVVGIAVFMGGETTPNRAIVQSAGFGYRMGGRPSRPNSTGQHRSSICCCATPRR